jgi:thiamine biosynthesis lipoprotein
MLSTCHSPARWLGVAPVAGLTAALLPVLLSLVFACRAKEPPPQPPVVPPSDEVTTRSQDQMSTYVTIRIAAPESRAVLDAIDAAFAEICRLQEVLSEWRPASEISKVNAAAGKGPVVVGEELFEVIELAHEVSRTSGGAFDVTFASLHGLWDFRSLKPELPDPAALAERVELVDYSRVSLDPAQRTVALEIAGMRIGLGGIAKGTIVDAASAVLTARGYVNHLIVAGGDLYASGRKASRRWNIGVRDPRGRGLHATSEVENEGVATSGNYERYFIKDGKRYHHILDPTTGMPARGVSSVTVIASSAGLADAYSTAVFVLGKEEGIALARARPNLEALLFDDTEYAAVATPGMRARLAGVVAPSAQDAESPVAGD